MNADTEPEPDAHKEPWSPDPDPFEEPQWTLAMAAAWAIWREPDKVRTMAVGTLRASLFDAFNKHVEELPDDALSRRNGFMNAFRSGSLVANGIPVNRRYRTDIPASQWTDLGYFDPASFHLFGGHPDDLVFNHGEIAYSTVRVSREAVLRLWEVPAPIEPQTKEKPAQRKLTDDQAKGLIRAAAEKKGGFISLTEGETILRARDSGFKRDQARAITRSVVGNEKRGPRGPRKNSAK